MALNLHIPVITEPSKLIAETNAQKISLALANLGTQNTFEIAAYVSRELQILNRQKFSAVDRVEALDAYSPLIKNTAHALETIYANSTLPIHDNAKLSATAAELLWQEFAFGYKLALIDLQNKLVKIGSNKASVHVITRAIHAITEHSLVYYQTYMTPPDHVWSDLHQLYFCAVQLGIQHIKPANESNALSVENSYIHALLLALADPQHLAQKDIRLVSTFLAYHVNLAQIMPANLLDVPTSTFIINLKSNQPPIPYIKQKSVPDPIVDILLQTIELVRVVHMHLGSLQNNQWPKDGSIPLDGNRNEYIDLLIHLIKYWGITPKRSFSRSATHGELDLVAGITSIHHTITEHATVSPPPVRPSLWHILNVSASGMLIRRHPTAEKNIRIGSLLGIKTKDKSHWALGVVRWASCSNRDKLEIGVQLIAPSAQSATAQIKDREYKEAVLLLPEITATSQLASLVAPIGTYEPARLMIIQSNNHFKHVMLTKLVERTNQFERIQYSVISEQNT